MNNDKESIFDTVVDAFEDKEVFPATSKHIDIDPMRREWDATLTPLSPSEELAMNNRIREHRANTFIAKNHNTWLLDLAVEQSRLLKVKAKNLLVKPIDYEAAQRIISKTNQDDDRISHDNEQAISKDIDVDGISLSCISHSEENGRRLSKFVKELTKKPRVIYYQNGECQRTLI